MQADENERTAPYVCRVCTNMASPANQACRLGDLGGEHIAQEARKKGATSDALMSWQGTRRSYLAERGHVIVMQGAKGFFLGHSPNSPHSNLSRIRQYMIPAIVENIIPDVVAAENGDGRRCWYH